MGEREDVQRAGAFDHHCHAVGCKAWCAPIKLMCWKHWCLVPAVIQAAVYRHYREGQCDGDDVEPSEKWHQAADAAIGAVALLEDKQLRHAHLLALLTVPKDKLTSCPTLLTKMSGLVDPRSRQLQP